PATSYGSHCVPGGGGSEGGPSPLPSSLRQRFLERDQVLQALGHGRRAPDDVVGDGDRLRVVLAVPGLLVGRDDLALLVLLAEQLEIDPAVVGGDDLRVLVH